jgi:two-component system LytT family response regulator
MPISAIIVDDEVLARERMRSLLAAHADVEITSEFATAAAARDFLERQCPDVVLLDVQLGDRSGLSIANMTRPGELPFVIFTTAFSEYAVQAFESRAVDYIVKPVEPARLCEALDRVRQRLRNGDAPSRDASAPAKAAARIAVSSGDRTTLVRLADIDWIEAVGNYIKLHVGDQSYVVRSALYAFEKRLDPSEFVRIHRKYVVNVTRVREISRGIRRGEYLVQLDDGQSLPMQRAYAASLREAVGRF